MRKVIAVVLLLCVIACVPSISFTEDAATVRLARVICALAGNDSYEAKLAIGTVVMNRVESPWFPDTLEDVRPPVEANIESSLTVSAWPPGQAAGASDSLIGRFSANTVSQVLQRNS
mgnify:CR=1 FL=1